jgi:hypothetical protein
MYCLIIEFGFVSTSDSFNNRIAHVPGFVEPSPSKLTGSFVRLTPLNGVVKIDAPFQVSRAFFFF